LYTNYPVILLRKPAETVGMLRQLALVVAAEDPFVADLVIRLLEDLTSSPILAILSSCDMTAERARALPN
jgi:hypothetical protein